MSKLKRFLNPRTIAVIGASNNKGKVGNILMLKLSKFKGKIIPINLNQEDILGRKSYSSITNYKEKIDLAVIAIPAKHVKKALEECAQKRIKNVIIISAGFSEIGNKDLEKEISTIAEKHKINLLGPNCFGIANPYLNLDTTFANSSVSQGNTAFISQSGALWSYISDFPELSFSGFVSVGNMAGLGFSDFIKYFNKDKNTKKIILYIEKLKKGKEFIKICRKSKKEIIVVKAGKSAIGKEATISHTGSLATDFEIYKGAFKQARIKRADSIIETFKLKKQELPKISSKKISIITNAGGAGALIADYLSEEGYTPEKPIDILGTATPEDYKKALEELKESKNENIAVILTPQKMSNPEKTAKILSESEKKDKIIAFFLGENSIKKAKKILEKAKIQCITRI